jgi:DNA-binding LacI/PurR family transcriptional regulator
VPVVFIDVHTPSVENVPRVVGDDLAGGALAARHLLELGHRSIGFIGDSTRDPFGFTSSRDREIGLRDGLVKAGIVIPPDWVGHGAHGRYEARDLARAIFAASDTQALGVIAAARELGIQVPEDLSVIGYDDIEAADYVGLTTVRQQLFASGRRGAEILLSEIRERSETPPVVHLSPELVTRATTARSKEGRA